MLSFDVVFSLVLLVSMVRLLHIFWSEDRGRRDRARRIFMSVWGVAGSCALIMFLVFMPRMGLQPWFMAFVRIMVFACMVLCWYVGTLLRGRRNAS
ncbi:MAG: hypothetical protein ABIH41_05645 [Nanoarchaeota archaeon]